VHLGLELLYLRRVLGLVDRALIRRADVRSDERALIAFLLTSRHLVARHDLPINSNRQPRTDEPIFHLFAKCA
jgi:hypothetical protein